MLDILLDITQERCRQCGGRLCSRLADFACSMCGLPWTPPAKAVEPAPAQEAPAQEVPAQESAATTANEQSGRRRKG